MSFTSPCVLAFTIRPEYYSCVLTETLLTYVTTLAFYLYIRAGLPTSNQSINTLRIKPVLERLLTLKQALSTMEELDLDEDGEDDDFDSYLDEEEKAELERLFGPSPGIAMKEYMDHVSGPKNKLGVGELDALLRDADATINEDTMSRIGTRPSASGKKTHSRKSTKGTKTATLSSKIPTFDLVEPTFVPSRRNTMRSDDSGLEAYGEATTLSMTDDSDKKARKRTLRFHTSKIETSARRREEGRGKLGGMWL